LLLIDTWANGITGKIAEAALEKNGIICNKNTIPGETRSPFDPSGIRVGTPAMTTSGYKEKDFIKVAQKIDIVLRRVL
ncbi:serine hydroxymethyltransferase, partial [Candidatus Parcubacteria bacterium]|nr:serine hydroxymethyltransferase [Candidatus Parcubacteria bacterium]